MKISNLPIDPGPSGWQKTAPPVSGFFPLMQSISADYLIIGAGFAGLSAAQRLTQLSPNATIVVLDAVGIAEGPAGRNSGFMIDLPHDLSSKNYGGEAERDKSQITVNRRAIKFAKEMATEFNLPKGAFSQTGKINGAATEKGEAHNAQYARHLSSLTEPFIHYDHDKMQEVTGSQYYRSGLYTPGCAIIQPATYIAGIAVGLRNKGVQIYENSPVVELLDSTSWVAKTKRGAVSAKQMLLATNGHLNSFGFYKNQFMHVFTYASMTRNLTEDEIMKLGGEASWGITPADPLGTTVRRTSGTMGERLVVRNRFTYDPSMAVPKTRIHHVARDHDEAFAKRFPMLSEVDMEFRWGGRLCLSINDVQVGEEVRPNLFSAGCHNGLGSTKGTMGGILAAEKMAGFTSDKVSTSILETPPRRLWPAPIMTPVARTVLKLKERQAGAEM